MKINEIETSLSQVITMLDNCKLEQYRNRYIGFLTQTYFFVSHSIPLLEFAIRKSKNVDFIQRSTKHIEEEHAHDLIVLNDLRRLGVNKEELKEWEWTKQFHGYQYDLIENEGELLLGYILALEGIAVSAREVLTKIEAKYGKLTTKFARIHVEEDQDHLPLAIEQINKSIHKEEIYKNFQYTVNEYMKFLKQVEAIDDRKKLVA